MNYRNLNTKIINLDSLESEIMSYMFLDAIPADWYKTVLSWVTDKLDFNKMTISITDHKGFNNLTVVKEPVVVDSDIGYCEIELRGMLYDVDLDNEILVLSCSFMPVLHYTINGKAMCMFLAEYDLQEIQELFDIKLLPILEDRFSDVGYVEDAEQDIEINMTRYFQTIKDVEAFEDQDTINIVTTKFFPTEW